MKLPKYIVFKLEYRTDGEEHEVGIEDVTDKVAVSVVRCKECKLCNTNYVDMTPPYAHNYCYKFSRYVNADDYCSYGEAKESE